MHYMESMEWSKDKTLKLIELLQMNPSIWNPSLCDSRRNKQKRKDELVAIAHILGISVADSTKKIQHLRTQYNRESAREARAIAEEPNERYVSNWYAFEYLHFMKDSNKPYRVLDTHDREAVIPCIQSENTTDCKLPNHSPPHKISRTEALHSVKPELPYLSPPRNNRDEFSVFGEYIANELRTLKGEKNLLVAKKKIQDVIFDVKMGMIAEHRTEPEVCTVYSHASHATPTSIHSNKLYTSPALITTAHIEPLSSTHTSPTSQISEIIINSACHYSNFKVDNQ